MVFCVTLMRIDLRLVLEWPAMISFHAPELVRSIADRYKDIAREGGIPYPLLCAYIAMTVFGMSSLSDFVRSSSWVASHSVLSAALIFFNKKLLSQAMDRLSWSVLKRVHRNAADWVFAVDTTKNPKRTTGLTGSGLWGDSNGSVYTGRNLLVVAAVNTVTGEAIPVAFEPCLKPSERKESGSASTQTLALLDRLVEQGWPRLTVILDSWFDSVDFMRALNERKFTFVIELKSFRKLKTNPSPRVKRKSFEEVFAGLPRKGVRAGTSVAAEKRNSRKNLRFTAGKVVWLQGGSRKKSLFQVKAAAVYNHPRERSAFGYYATNSLSKSDAWLWKMSRVRWNIEVMFRDLKQYMAWGKQAFHSEEGNDLFLFLPVAVLAWLREKHEGQGQIGKMLAELKQSEILRSVKFMMENPNSEKVKKYISRNNKEYAHKKPVDSAAEKAKSRGKSRKAA